MYRKSHSVEGFSSRNSQGKLGKSPRKLPLILAEAGERIEAIANILPDSPSVSSQRNKSLNMQGKWNKSVDRGPWERGGTQGRPSIISGEGARMPQFENVTLQDPASQCLPKSEAY